MILRGLLRIVYIIRILRRLNSKLYKTVWSPAMLYDTECWELKNNMVHKMNVAKMKILRQVMRVTKRE